MTAPRRWLTTLATPILVSALALMGVLALGPKVALGSDKDPSFPERLDGLRVTGKIRIASDSEGSVAAWDPEHKLLGRWDRRGELVESCVLHDSTLPTDAADFAVRDDRALLSFFNAAVEEQGGRRELVVDLRRCEVVSTFAVKGITTELVGTSDGWVQFSSPDELQSGRFRFSILDEKGKVVDELDVDRPLAQLVKEKKYKAPLGPYDMRPFVLGKEVWGIPSGVYELWRPPQHGKPFRRVAPPNCLAAQGQELTGQENVQHVLELSKNWPDEVRESIERGAKHGGLAPSFLSPTSHIKVWDRFVAVQVRDWKATGAERVDVWNMDTESIVAVVGIPGTASLVAFNDSGLWLKVDEGRLEQLPLPDLWPEKYDACAAAEELKTGKVAPAQSKEPPPSTSGASTDQSTSLPGTKPPG